MSFHLVQAFENVCKSQTGAGDVHTCSTRLEHTAKIPCGNSPFGVESFVEDCCGFDVLSAGADCFSAETLGRREKQETGDQKVGGQWRRHLSESCNVFCVFPTRTFPNFLLLFFLFKKRQVMNSYIQATSQSLQQRAKIAWQAAHSNSSRNISLEPCTRKRQEKQTVQGLWQYKSEQKKHLASPWSLRSLRPRSCRRGRRCARCSASSTAGRTPANTTSSLWSLTVSRLLDRCMKGSTLLKLSRPHLLVLVQALDCQSHRLLQLFVQPVVVGLLRYASLKTEK